MADNDQEKTEEPTAKRESEFRERGQVPKSNELNLVATFIIALIVISINGENMVTTLKNLLSELFNRCGSFEVSASNFNTLLDITIIPMLKLFAPIFVLLLMTAVFINVAQSGWVISLKSMEPDLSKLNPIQGAKKLFAMSAFFELVKNILKVSVIFVIVYLSVRDEIYQIISMNQLELLSIFTFFSSLLFKILYRVAIYLVALSALDFFFKRWELIQKMKMTKQEVKDEHKNIQGDPQMRGQFARKRSEIATSRIMQAVPRADVIVTNPTHFAVALEYVKGSMLAPRVIAKGKDQIALRIREAAKELAIPVIENPPLARVLYKSVKIGQQIPEKFYSAVAEILAFVYKQGRTRR